MVPAHLPRLKAPRQNGELLAYPPLDSVGALLSQKSLAGGSLLGRSLSELQQLARREMLDAATQELSAAGEPAPTFSGDHWLVSGHQPELFHPGVWVKNFVLQSLARKHNAVPLNLVVDNDVAKAAMLRVPAGERVVSVPFDAGGREAPFEERVVEDEAVFDSLPARLREFTRDWPFRPWVDGVWAELRRVAPGTRNLGQRIVRARRTLERSMGLSPLEVTIGAMCRTEAFAWFACGLLADAPRLAADYNAAVHDYRRRHHLKSKNHPVPDLAVRGDHTESPFWVWRASSPRRHRLFVARTGRGVQLFADDQPIAELAGEPRAWASSWKGLEKDGIKVRTRALTTTLFSRLLLADVFLHGIGGGKYDEVTSDLISRFLGLMPPPYLVVTATLLLPFSRDIGVHDRWFDAKRAERDLWYNPQRHLVNGSPEVAQLIARKHEWIASPETTHEERVARFRGLLQATAHLRPFIADRDKELKREIVAMEKATRRDGISAARDYSFCLYPEVMLRLFMTAY
jgi:hypothetical protein